MAMRLHFSLGVEPKILVAKSKGENMTELPAWYWENLIRYFIVYALLALMIERALYQIFDSKLWRFIEKRLDVQSGSDFMDLKPWISVAVSVAIVFRLDLDLIAIVLVRDPQNHEPISKVLTGLFIAGGSTGIYKFLRRARKMKEVVTGNTPPTSP